MPDEDDLIPEEAEGPAGAIGGADTPGGGGAGPIGAQPRLEGRSVGEIGTQVAQAVGTRRIQPPNFGIAGMSVEAPGAYQGGSPVGGPGSIFNIGGAPIAILGGVFSGGLPIGGPVSQIFRSGGLVPNTLFIITLESSGPIGAFFIGGGGEPIGMIGTGGIPFGIGPFEGGNPIGAVPMMARPFGTIPTGGQPLGPGGL